MRRELFSQPVAASLPVSLGDLPKSLPNSPASQRTSMVSGPVTLIGVVGVVAWARQRSATAFASPCQITLTWPIDEIDRLAVAHLAADVVQDAVTHVDGVVQAEQTARRAVLGGEILEHALATDAGSRRSRRAAAPAAVSSLAPPLSTGTNG